MKPKEVSLTKIRSVYTRLAVRCVFILSLIFGGWAIARGVSDVLIIQPVYLMTQWEKNGGMDSDDGWQEAIESLDFANHINPGNPGITFDIACLFEWKAMQKPIWTTHAHHYRALAIIKYRQTLEKRPTWAFAWASLAQNKFLNQEIDQEMWVAMRNAITYGQWEFGVQKKISWLGIATWKFNHPDLQKRVKEVIEGSLRNPRLYDFIFATAVSHRWEENLRPLLLGEVQKRRLQRLVKRRD